MDPKLVSEQTNAYDFLQQKIYSPFFLAYNEKGKIFKESLTKNLENCLNSKKIKTTSNASKMLLNITSPKAIGTLGSSPRIILQNSGSNTSLKVIKSSIVSKHQEPNIEMSPLSSKLILSPRSIKSSNSPIDLGKIIFHNLFEGNNTHKRRIVNENQIIEKFLKKRGSKSNFPVVELPTLNTRKIIKK